VRVCRRNPDDEEEEEEEEEEEDEDEGEELAEIAGRSGEKHGAVEVESDALASDDASSTRSARKSLMRLAEVGEEGAGDDTSPLTSTPMRVHNSTPVDTRSSKRAHTSELGVHGTRYSPLSETEYQKLRQAENQRLHTPAHTPRSSPVPTDGWHGAQRTPTLSVRHSSEKSSGESNRPMACLRIALL
jgi:hypothetical protein